MVEDSPLLQKAVLTKLVCALSNKSVVKLTGPGLGAFVACWEGTTAVSAMTKGVCLFAVGDGGREF